MKPRRRPSSTPPSASPRRPDPVPRVVLLVPSTATALELLRPGAGNARMPIVVFAVSADDPAGDEKWIPVEEAMNVASPAPMALLLAANGHSVPEGCDRLARIFNSVLEADGSVHRPQMEMGTGYSLTEAIAMGNRYVARLGGRLVVGAT